MPETLRSLVGDGSIPPPRLNSSPQQLWQHHKATVERKRTGVEKVHVDRPEKRKVSSDLTAAAVRPDRC